VNTVQKKLKELPKGPGVYFHKNKSGKIIYIGKAARLNNRVRQYFQASRLRDPKTDALVAEIVDLDWVEVETELDALFLEAELIRRYQPQYNILLRDDKSLSFIRIDIKSDHPTVSLVRRPLDDGAEYFGPYYSAFSIKKALKYLRKVFPFDRRRPASSQKRPTLDYHLGLSPGLEKGKTTLNQYRSNLRQLIRYLKGGRKSIMKEIEVKMRRAASKHEFEQAAKLRNQYRALESLHKQIIFSDKEFMDLSKDAGLNELTELLGLKTIPRRIEGFDISHMSGTDTVASMVVFQNGMPDKAEYRKFKMRIPGNDDFAHMNEVINRRVSEKNRRAWGLPSIFLIDGGKGQLGAALEALEAAGLETPAIGLAKQQEQIVISKKWASVNLSEKFAKKIRATIEETDDFILVNVPHESHVVKLLQRIRDESHRFAVSYHSTLKVKRTTKSLLDEVPTIGPATKKKLLRHFGSVKGIEQARHIELVELIGESRATILRQYLRAMKNQR
jgi:excinuclease ABC subunit C